MAEIESTTLPVPIPTPMNVTALAKRFGVARSTIQRRLKRGWTPPAKVPRRARKAAASSAANATPDATPDAALARNVITAPAAVATVTPRLQILPRSQELAAPSRLGAVLLLVAFAVAALGVGINVQTGWAFGSTLVSSVTFSGLSVAADVLAITLPSVAVALWLRSHRALAAAAWSMWTLALALAALASIGFVNLNVGDASAARAAVMNTATMATEQRDAAIVTAQQSVTAAAQSRQAECVQRGPRCRALEEEEQTKLNELSAALAAPLPAAVHVADADPQLAGVLRLANWAGLGVTPNDLGNLRLALMALLPNLAGVVLCFGLALRRSM